MFIRFVVALLLGALIGVERELVGKDAGIRTLMLIAAGAAVFSMIALQLPFLLGGSIEGAQAITINNATFLMIIANIVMAAGFLGAGIIIKTQEHVHGLTTAAMIWTTAGVGILAGVGMIPFAIGVTVTIALVLYFLRGFAVSSTEIPKNPSK